MAQMLRGLVGMGAFGWCVLGGLGTLGCGSSDEAAGPKCGTILEPGEFKISNVLPARGASVPNTSIVQSFTIEGELLELTPSFGETALHTAGDPTPNPLGWTLTPSASGKDSVYTSDPVTWATAPGHVELAIGGLTTNQTTTCTSRFPSPIFSYDVTAP